MKPDLVVPFPMGDEPGEYRFFFGCKRILVVRPTTEGEYWLNFRIRGMSLDYNNPREGNEWIAESEGNFSISLFSIIDDYINTIIFEE